MTEQTFNKEMSIEILSEGEIMLITIEEDKLWGGEYINTGKHPISYGNVEYCMDYLNDEEAWKLGQFVNNYFQNTPSHKVAPRFKKYCDEIYQALDKRNIDHKIFTGCI